MTNALQFRCAYCDAVNELDTAPAYVRAVRGGARRPTTTTAASMVRELIRACTQCGQDNAIEVPRDG